MIDDVTDALVAISRHFGVMERDMVCCGDVTVQQCVALQRLRKEPGGVSSLADYLGTSVSATTRLVDGLERKGWLERGPDPEDGRRVQLTLTDSGREEADELRCSTEDVASELLEYIPDDERENVVRVLGVLADAFSKCRGRCC